MATTPNYGWVMPDPTDFVTNLPADFEIFGDAVDTTLEAIETKLDVITTEGDLVVGDASGDPVRVPVGTVGQVLASDGTTIQWVNPDDPDAIQNAIIDAKGDLISATAADTPARLGVGTDGHVLIADSAQATGLKWAVDPTNDVITTAGDLIYGTAADTVARLGIGTAGQVLQVNGGATAPQWANPGSALNWTLLNTGGTTLIGSDAVTISGIDHENILILIFDAGTATASQQYNIRLNSIQDYRVAGFRQRYNSTYASAFVTAERSANATSISFVETSTNTASRASGYCYITGGKGTASKGFWSNGAVQTPTNNADFYQIAGMSVSMAAVTSVTFRNTSPNNFSDGTIFVYGA
jgi:hypothetical protein